MLIVHGHEINFDVTCPADMQRYMDAEAAMYRAAETVPPMPSEPSALATMAGMQAYQSNLAAQCKLLTDFIDAAFGDGTCNALLGPKTSLSTLMDVVDDLRDAIADQGEQIAKRMETYRPNRATRRKAAK